MGTDKETTEKETAEKGMQTREDSIRRDYGFASDVELKECRYCRVMIPKKAKVCPNCRMNLKRYWFRNTVAVVFAIAVIGVGGYYLSEHWGIMRDAVMSVWMAQDGTAVPAVSVTTVGTAELAAGAASTETSEVANSAKTGGQEADSAETSTQTSADTSERSQSREADENQADSNKAAEKETVGSDGSDAGALSEDETEEEQNAESDDAVSGITAGKKNTAASDTEDEETAGSAERKDSGQDASEEKDTVKAATNTTDSDKEKDQDAGASEEEEEQKSAGSSRQAADDMDEEPDDVSEKDLDEEEQTFRDRCVEISYKTLLRDTEACLDTGLKVELQVVCQVIGGLFDENIYYLCKVEEVSSIERYYIIRDDREADDTLILEGDTLTVYGQLFGTCKLPAGLIETRPTVPAVSMLYFELTEE